MGDKFTFVVFDKRYGIQLQCTVEFYLFELQAYQTRLRKVMDASQNSTDAASVLFIETLDKSEREIFAAGQQGLADFLLWESRGSERIVSSDMVTNLKKRKRIQMEDS